MHLKCGITNTSTNRWLIKKKEGNMNKRQYKNLSSRVRAAFRNAVEARQAAGFSVRWTARKIAHRMGIKPIDTRRLAICRADRAGDDLYHSPGFVLYKQTLKQARACRIALDALLDAVNHLNGWRVVDVVEAV